jgi:deoxyribodipyrimidine photolyase-related protein
MIGMTNPSANGPTTIWITGDQCTLRNSALAGLDRSRSVVLMIESTARAKLQPYHKRKLVLIYSVMRHFAEDLRAAGWTVDYHRERDDYVGPLAEHVARHRPAAVRWMMQSEWGADERLRALAAAHGLAPEITPHVNFLSEAHDFDRLAKSAEARVTMENFYRGMRRKTGYLLDDGEPVGGAWNYDAENREKPNAKLTFPAPLRFAPDAITREVIAFVERAFPDHPGIVGDFAIPVSRADALRALDDFIEHRLDTFGPHQDAMLAGRRTMSHSLLSAAINTCLLDPAEVCERAELAYRSGAARLQSVEGFIRQIIGWREYIWRIYWRMMPEYRSRNALGAHLPLPTFYWTGETQMVCLADALSATVETAYAHHIQRLMVLGNFALIAGFDPVETNDWFWAMFIDGYDWVMVPNVIGMTLHADGGYVGTKPYAASANYINGMSDYCKPCRYDPKKLDGDDACPFNALYWDFLARNEERFAKNPRMGVVMRNWQGRPLDWRARVRAKAAETRQKLAKNAPI